MIQLVRTVTLLVTAVALFLVITDYPLGGFFVGFGLLTYAAIVWKYPYAPVFLIPALLPILDFSPLTGRFFFNEFDILLLATVFLSACQKQGPPLPLVLPRGNSMLLYLFVLSSSIAIIKGAWPLHWPDINSFNNYYSGLNGLRSAKGCLWAIFFLPLLRREVAADASTVYRLFVYGMVGGVVLASSVVVAERLAFTGLLNYTNPYRVVGPFFEMHNGGAFIEGYFVVSLPFVAWFVVMQKQWPWRIIGLLIFLIGGYCMVVTYARGGYLAMMVAMTVLAFFSLKESAGSRSSTTILLMVMCFGLLAASAVPVLRNGGVMAGRFASSHGDLLSRAAQWQEALSMMGNSWIVKLTGIGTGVYPRLSAARMGKNRQIGSYKFVSENQNRYLILTPGDPLYFEQIVPLLREQKYRITLSIRASNLKSKLEIPICEKWLLYSARCYSESIIVGDTQSNWKKFVVEVKTDWIAKLPWYAFRPIKFSMYNAGDGILEISDVSVTLYGFEVLKNGNFDQLMDHWFISTDQFETWHFENTWLQMYFEQGIIGVLLFLCLLMCVGRATWTRRFEFDFPVAPIIAALCGFLILGILDSLFDFPRLGFIFYLLVIFLVLKKPVSPFLK